MRSKGKRRWNKDKKEMEYGLKRRWKIREKREEGKREREMGKG